MKHDCNNCPARKLLDSAFEVIYTQKGDTTCTDHCCGCLEYFLYDDTPGFREKDEWINSKNCILDDSRLFFIETRSLPCPNANSIFLSNSFFELLIFFTSVSVRSGNIFFIKSR